jgi:hypothetical protein
VVIHGTADLIVPVASGRDAARRLGATFIAVEGARHCWLLRDPETLPGVFSDLLQGPLGDVWTAAVAGVGLDPQAATLAEIEAAMCRPDAAVIAMTPTLEFSAGGPRRKDSTYRWAAEEVASA